jgi:hypothetical protein
MTITQENLKELLHYNPITGVFTNIVDRNSKALKGEECTCINQVGYVVISINYKRYTAHRLAWLYMEGYFPEHEVDHKNGVTHDNRWKNLKEVSHRCNLQNQKIRSNNSSGFKGVTYVKRNSNWSSRITINQKTINIGVYPTAIEAAIARCKYEDTCDEWSCDERDKNRTKLRELGYYV